MLQQPNLPVVLQNDLPLYVQQLAEGAQQLTIPQTSNCPLLLWWRTGVGTLVVDFIPHALQQESLYYLRPGCLYYLQNLVGSNGYAVHIAPALQNYVTAKTSNPFTYDELAPLPVTPAARRTLEQHLVALQEEQERAYPTSCVAVEALWILLWVEAIRLRQRQGLPFKVQDERFRQFMQLLQANYAKPLELPFYAEAVGLSTKQLTRICLREVGLTPGQLVQNRRHLQAKRLLWLTDLPLMQLSAQLGFTDPAYFTRFFQRLAGLGPAAFRNLRPQTVLLST